MKKWGFLLFIIICLGGATAYITSIFQSDVEIQSNGRNHIENSGNRGNGERMEAIEITNDQIHQGNLLLVNTKYPLLRGSVKTDIVRLAEHKELTEVYGLLNADIRLSKGVAQKFSKMVKAARKDGVNHFLISSGFRSFERQSQLYNKKGPDYALPAGHSEHNLGLSLDVGSSLMSMYDAPEAEWIEKNAWKYGFILRYPKDKTNVTGIEYEPWHVRYVGLPHSAVMQEMNFALEEYLDYLKEEKSISVNVDGKRYTISYYPVSESMTIHVPENHKYEVSGNNIDGVIVTVYE